MSSPIIIRTERDCGAEALLEGLTGTQEFSIWNVVPNITCMAGLTTSGRAAYGRVTAVLPGMGFVVNTGTQTSILWKQLWLLDNDPAEMGRRLEPISDTALRRTDSGSDYGFVGFPDCEFWAANGISANYVVLPEHYRGFTGEDTPAMKARIREVLEDEEERVPADGPYREAWDRQFADVSTLTVAELQTPPSSPKVRECPGAPSRPERPPPLTLPTLADHKGRGILPEYFRLPDSPLTRQEMRAYIRQELTRYLTDCPVLLAHAKEASTCQTPVTNWPARRMDNLMFLHREFGMTLRGMSFEDRYMIAGRYALKECLSWLEHGDESTYLNMVVGFVREDRFPDGRTIADLWNSSAFDALREAGPLPDAEEPEDLRSQNTFSLEVTMDDFLIQKVAIRLPVWGWLALYGVVLVYMWLVATVVRSGR